MKVNLVGRKHEQLQKMIIGQLTGTDLKAKHSPRAKVGRLIVIQLFNSLHVSRVQ
jgi:hypothetical protein